MPLTRVCFCLLPWIVVLSVGCGGNTVSEGRASFSAPGPTSTFFYPTGPNGQGGPPPDGRAMGEAMRKTAGKK
jgi:hypothetical protein